MICLYYSISRNFFIKTTTDIALQTVSILFRLSHLSQVVDCIKFAMGSYQFNQLVAYLCIYKCVRQQLQLDKWPNNTTSYSFVTIFTFMLCVCVCVFWL